MDTLQIWPLLFLLEICSRGNVDDRVLEPVDRVRPDLGGGVEGGDGVRELAAGHGEVDEAWEMAKLLISFPSKERCY